MTLFNKPVFDRIKNASPLKKPGDFTFSLFNFLLMVIIVTVGTLIASLVAEAPPTGVFIRGLFAILFGALCYAFFHSWNVILVTLLLAQLSLFAATAIDGEWRIFAYEPNSAALIYIAFVSAALIIGPCLQIVAQWDKAVVLRLGKFHKVRGPGVFFLAPLLDRFAALVDTRIRVTDFSAEKILTKDTVPVNVDALAFWMIWDAQKAILEVEDFLQAVTLSAQTALRDSVGKYSLSTILAERDTLYREIQSILDAKTNPWGITILSVEFVDIQLPKALEDVMSRQAQAEREKKARLILGDAELDLSKKFSEAAKVYQNDPTALRLRSMNMIYDAMKARGSIVVVPSSGLNDMNMGLPVLISKALKDKANEETGISENNAPDNSITTADEASGGSQ